MRQISLLKYKSGNPVPFHNAIPVICKGGHAQMERIALSGLRHQTVRVFKCTCRTVKQKRRTYLQMYNLVSHAITMTVIAHGYTLRSVLPAPI